MTEDKKKKLLFVGYPPNAFWSGQGRVALSLTKRFSNYFDVRVAGWGCKEPSQDPKVFIYPNSEEWWKIIPDWKPDVLFLSHDCWRFPILPEVRRNNPNLKICGYFTIDADPVSKSWFPIFDACDILLVPSTWGRNVIRERYSARPIYAVPQGIEIDTFFHKVDKSVEKKAIDINTEKMDSQGKQKLYFANKFTISFFGQNQTKKNIGGILDGFAEFAEGKETLLILGLHSNLVTDSFGNKIVSDYDISDMYSWRRIGSKLLLTDKILSEQELVRSYAVSDVLLSPSIGEGFGLFVLESMSLGVIPIISYYSAFTELPAKDSCFFLQPTFFRTTWNSRRSIVSPRDITKTLEMAYAIWKNNPGIWKNMQEANYQRVLEFSWDHCAMNIIDFLLKLTKGDTFFDPELRKI